MKRAKFSSREKVQTTPGGGNLRAPGEEVVSLGEKGASLRLVKTIAGLVLAALVVLFLLYTALAATLMRAIPVWDDFPTFTWVKNATFVAGIPEPGTYAFVSGKGADNTIVGHLEQAFVGVEYGAVVEIIGGPYGAVVNGPNQEILIEGVDTGYVGALPESQPQPITLDNQYVAQCVDGACGEPGGIVIIGQDLLVGEADFRYSNDEGFVTYGEDTSTPGTVPDIEIPTVDMEDALGSDG